MYSLLLILHLIQQININHNQQSQKNKMSSENVTKEPLLEEDQRPSMIESIESDSNQQRLEANDFQHQEHHIQSGEYLKSAVYGGLDGVVNSLTVIIGGIGSGSNPYAIMAVGIAVLFSDGMGMGLGDYLSSKAESEFIKAEKGRELWQVHNKLQQEKREVKEIYMDKGYTRQQSVRIANLYATNDQAFVNIMMLQELGLVDSDSSPFWNGVVTLAAFVLFGFIPLIPYVIGAGFQGNQQQQYLLIALILGTLELFSLGFAKAVLIGLNKFKAGLQTLILGGLAVAVGYGIGVAFQVDTVSATQQILGT